VYGPAGPDPVSEDAALRPATPYGRSKLMTECMLEDVAGSYPFNYCARLGQGESAEPLRRGGVFVNTAQI